MAYRIIATASDFASCWVDLLPVARTVVVGGFPVGNGAHFGRYVRDSREALAAASREYSQAESHGGWSVILVADPSQLSQFVTNHPTPAPAWIQSTDFLISRRRPPAFNSEGDPFRRHPSILHRCLLIAATLDPPPQVNIGG